MEYVDEKNLSGYGGKFSTTESLMVKMRQKKSNTG